MIKVITYGTYDLLHRGHIRLLQRAKALGDYLIVGVTTDDFDKSRGKINVQQSLMERIENVKATGLADEIIAEEYEGQKIDDIKRYGVDIFTVGSDWEGKFDYLSEYCRVVYLPRTEGISSTEIRAQEQKVRLGFVGTSSLLQKVMRECTFVNGLSPSGTYTDKREECPEAAFDSEPYAQFLRQIDAVYIASHPREHYRQIRQALLSGKHVACESPVCLSVREYEELCALAQRQGCILMDCIKTAYSTAYSRLLLLVKSGKIGKVVSVDSTCTSLSDLSNLSLEKSHIVWNSRSAWGPTALLPVFQILGTDYTNKHIVSSYIDEASELDYFTKIDFLYPSAVASIKVGKGMKSEGQLIVSGTKGYIYVPAPWWKTDYFEIRYENPVNNQRYFYQLDGEGIRYELVIFLKAIRSGDNRAYIERSVSREIVRMMQEKGERIL